MRLREYLDGLRERLAREPQEQTRRRIPQYGTPEFTAFVTPKGVNVSVKDKARRRARNKVARASRKANRHA